MGCCLSEFAEELPMFAKEEKRRTSNSDSDDRRSWKRRRSSSEDDGGFKDWQGREVNFLKIYYNFLWCIHTVRIINDDIEASPQ